MGAREVGRGVCEGFVRTCWGGVEGGVGGVLEVWVGLKSYLLCVCVYEREREGEREDDSERVNE